MTAPAAPAMGEAPPRSASGAAFELQGGPDAVLLLHGLTGTPFEMRHVAERLHALGMRCRAPILPGHGGDPRALAALAWVDWVEGARRELAALGQPRRTFVVGCSMGALVACALAHDRPERVDGLVLLAPALELQPQGKLGALLGAALGRFGPLRAVAFPKGAGSDVRDPEMRAANPCMDAVPLAAVAELARFERHVDRILPGIAAPALVVQGAHDHTVTVRGARRLAERIGSGPAELRLLPRSFHLVGIDVERDACADAAAAFLAALPGPAASGRERKRRGRGERARGR